MNLALKLPHYANKTNPCGLFRWSGGSDENSWKDCRLSAKWLSMQWKPTESVVFLKLWVALNWDSFYKAKIDVSLTLGFLVLRKA